MMTRREFIKVAGAGVLAVSCAGMLSGCDAIESLQDMDFVSVTIGEVKFMVGSSSYTPGRGRVRRGDAGVLPADGAAYGL